MDKMDDLDFSKLLQDAEQLTAEIETSTDLPRVHRNLRQVLEAGQLLLSRTSREESLPNAETKASVFLGTRGVDITNMTKRLEPLYLSASSARPVMETVDEAGDTDIDFFLKNERSNLICSIVEATSKGFLDQLRENIYQNLENDWAEEKERILAELSGDWNPVDLDRPSFSTTEGRTDSTAVLSQAELTFTHEINEYNKAIIHGHTKPILLDRLNLVGQNSGDKNVEELWGSVHSMISGLTLPGDGNQSLIAKRSSPRFKKILIARAKQYLEKIHFNRLRSDVWKNLGKGIGASLTGVPAVIPMVKHFIQVRNLNGIAGLEVGADDIGPVWVIVYLCLRSGKCEDAAKYMREVVGNNEFATILEEYAKSDGGVGGELPKELEMKMKMEYRRVLRTSARDPFKRIIYCILAACDVQDDHSEVASRLDDYLWLKLSQIREDTSSSSSDAIQRTDILTYSAFQEMISVKYGESHFDAFKQPYTYFQALLLTGQFEVGIEFLTRVTTLRSHAVHLALVLNELSWLLVGDFKSRPLVPVQLPNEKEDSGLRTLNYGRMISQYARCFQGTNTKEALNYLFALRNMKDPNGVSLFAICVSELAVESRDFALLFGVMNTDGCRTPGILETMGIDIKPIVEYCATESEQSGMLEDAVVLYDVIGSHETALNVLVALLALHVNARPLPDSPRERVQDLAIGLADRYQRHPPQVTTKLILSTFYILVDCMTFFDEFFSGRSENCLAIIEKMKLIPLDKEEVDRCVVNFQTLADEVRRCVPDLILATIECLQIRYNKLKADRRGTFLSADQDSSEIQSLTEIKSKSKALVTYCGLLPYFMSTDVYTKVMQIEVQMN